MRRLKIALGDLSYINEQSTTNRNAGWVNNIYVPLNVGFLASYAKKKFGKEVEIEIFKEARLYLAHCRETRPDIVGLASYYWNQALNDHVVSLLRRDVPGSLIVAGGPSIDSDPTEKEAWRQRHGVDIAIPNEGEAGFASVIESRLGGAEINIPLGLSTDLADVPSPYLDGTLDAFLTGPYQPMIQTSRLCPFTCSFCVSGKSRGKLRAFPLDQVLEDIVYVAKRYADRPDHVMHIVDENFGILERDIAIADFVRKTGDRFGYPQKLFFYNDKRFTGTSRAIHEASGDLVQRGGHGVCLSLQSENPETLKAIKRRNLTDEQIVAAISWAHELGKKVSTELIFGLPMETRQSFLDLLDKCARLGFDQILCYHLIIFDGIEMNRAAYRDQHKLKTLRRLMHGNAGSVEGKLCVESEEVVMSSTTFGVEEYRFFRAMNVWFHAIFVNGLHKQFFKDMAARGESLTAFLSQLLKPLPFDDLWEHDNWLRELYAAIDSELYTDEQMEALIADADAGRRELPTEIKLQPIFARKLSDNEHGWVADAISRLHRQTRVAA